jgi:hypothetical protein
MVLVMLDLVIVRPSDVIFYPYQFNITYHHATAILHNTFFDIRKFIPPEE